MKATLYTTTWNSGKKKQSTYEFSFNPDEKRVEMQVLNLYPDVTYQTFDGFGGALTEASGYVLSHMGEDTYRRVLNTYYGDDGIGYRFARIHLDSCDFSLSNYAAVTDPDDHAFDTFSLARDARYVQPLVRRVLDAAGGNVKLMLTPWSPPAFMKTTNCRNSGGKLCIESYSSWAQYICRYLTEYQAIGIKISMLSIQNEPYAATPWDSCLFTPEEEKVFLRDFLYPELQKQGLGDVGLYIWDHNKERMLERAMEIIDHDTAPMIEGIAFHWYSGDHFDAVRMTLEALPGKKLIHTEGCTQYCETGSVRQLSHAQQYAHDIIGDLNAGATAYIDWNLVLDEKGGPNHVNNYCSAPVMCNAATGEVEYRLSFDYIAHFSKYIRPGAVRIGCSVYTDRLEVTAFQNPDRSIVLVMLNRFDNPVSCHCRICGEIAAMNIPAHTIATAVITF